MSFTFVGEIESSKSLMNRALIVKSFFPELRIKGKSSCDDVQNLAKSLEQMAYHPKVPLLTGYGGTTFRFLIARLTREVGSFSVNVPRKLQSRPHEPLLEALKRLGAQLQWTPKGIEIQSKGWSMPEGRVNVGAKESSQFLSALVLSSWQLEKNLSLQFTTPVASESYLKMTLDFLRSLGMEINSSQDGLIKIPSGQRLIVDSYDCEPDMSSCFAVAAFAAINGRCQIQSFPKVSLQPDFKFISIFQKMGIPVECTNGSLIVQSSESLQPLSIDLGETPDLFPVLSVLASQASGKSTFTGLENLIHKESNRLQKTAELLTLMKVEYQWDGGRSFIVHGKSKTQNHLDEKNNLKASFDPDEDHRMVMAAALAKKIGFPIEILDAHHVAKSFPNFFTAVQVTP